MSGEQNTDTDKGLNINFNLLKDIRDTANWMLSLPTRLVETFMAPREEYLARKLRIQRLKELVEIREVGKTLTDFAVFKGSLISAVQEATNDPDPRDPEWIRRMLIEAHQAFAELKTLVSESYLSDTSLGVEASMFLARGERAYAELSTVPIEALRKNGVLIEIGTFLETMVMAGSPLIEAVDEHRKNLDCTYGNWIPNKTKA